MPGAPLLDGGLGLFGVGKLGHSSCTVNTHYTVTQTHARGTPRREDAGRKVRTTLGVGSIPQICPCNETKVEIIGRALLAPFSHQFFAETCRVGSFGGERAQARNFVESRGQKKVWGQDRHRTSCPGTRPPFFSPVPFPRRRYWDSWTNSEALVFQILATDVPGTTSEGVLHVMFG